MSFKMLMKRKLNSRFHLCRKITGRYKNIWSSSKAINFRSINSNDKFKQISHFGKLLRSKQNMKFFYCNLKERVFKNRFKIAKKSRLRIIDRLLSLVEKRLDVVLFRGCFVFSFYQAKQMISHGHVILNGESVFSPCRNLNQFDQIKLKKMKHKALYSVFYNFEKKIERKKCPKHIEICFKNLSLCFVWLPCLFELNFIQKNDFSLVNRFYK